MFGWDTWNDDASDYWAGGTSSDGPVHDEPTHAAPSDHPSAPVKVGPHPNVDPVEQDPVATAIAKTQQISVDVAIARTQQINVDLARKQRALKSKDALKQTKAIGIASQLVAQSHEK